MHQTIIKGKAVIIYGLLHNFVNVIFFIIYVWKRLFCEAIM